MSEAVKKIQAMDKPQRVSISPTADKHGVMIRVDCESGCRALRVSSFGDIIKALAERKDQAGRDYYEETSADSVTAKDFKVVIRAMLLGLVGEIPVVVDDELVSDRPGPEPGPVPEAKDKCGTAAPNPQVVNHDMLTRTHTLLIGLLADPKMGFPPAVVVPVLERIRRQLRD